MSLPNPFIVDAHYDLLYDVFCLRRKGEQKVVERFYLEDLKNAGINVLICSLFVPNEYVPEMALRVALDQVGMLHCEMEESPGLFELCRSASEVTKAVGAGRMALLLSFEGIEPLGGDLVLLRAFYELGVRFAGLTWSRRNQAADGCHFHPLTEGTVGGLTPFGVALLEEVERLGMILDVSHLNDAGFADVLRFARRPFIASHSNSRRLCDVARNLTDEQIRELASRGGVMGLNNMLNFVYPDGAPEGCKIWEGLLDHARHIIDLAGPDHVGFGFDLCEFDKPVEDRNKSIFRTYRETVPFIEAVRSAFPGDAEKILGGNWMRIIEMLR
ncbi:MAG: dipeptidase [Synergistaceae bacterium]|nr:dipeptidase [Synergistaceae bacterium]